MTSTADEILRRFAPLGATAVRLTERNQPPRRYELEVDVESRDLTSVVQGDDLATVEERANLALRGRLWQGSGETLREGEQVIGALLASVRGDEAGLRVLLGDVASVGPLSRGIRNVAACCLLGIADVTGAHPADIARDIGVKLGDYRDRARSDGSGGPPARWEIAMNVLQLVTAELTGDVRRAAAIGAALKAKARNAPVPEGMFLLGTSLIEELGFALDVSAWEAGEWVAMQLPLNE